MSANDTDPIAVWTSFEERLSPQRYSGSDPAGSVLVVPGQLPVLVTAAHAVAHTRDGERKGADVATGGLVLLAAQASGARAVIPTGYQCHDPNRVVHGQVKELAAMARGYADACVDVHGFPDSFGVDICLGSGSLPHTSVQLLELAEHHFSAAGLSVSVDDPYGAKHRNSMTSSSQRAGTPAVQVEVARWLRRPFDDPEAALACAGALATFLQAAGHRP